jgi:hypothetical protein
MDDQVSAARLQSGSELSACTSTRAINPPILRGDAHRGDFSPLARSHRMAEHGRRSAHLNEDQLKLIRDRLQREQSAKPARQAKRGAFALSTR